MARMDGKYYYGLPSDAFMCGRVCISEENMYEGDGLYPEEMIIPFDNIVKSFNLKRTNYNDYYINVVLNDGTKINEITHF